MNYKSLSVFALLSCVAALYADRQVTPTIINRSQGRNAALKVAGLSEKVHLYDEGKYVNIDGTVAYEKSFRSNRLAECLFGDDIVNCDSILIQGSDVTNRDPKAWLADYFYLPSDFKSDFSIKPNIQTALVNLDLYIGLDSWIEGLYFRASGPITHSKWDLKYNELCDYEFTASSRPGYYTWDGMDNDQLLKTFGDYASGKAPLNSSGHPQTVLNNLGVSFQGLQYAKMERRPHSRTGFADLRLELGYNFLQSDDYHFGLNVQVGAPTGSRRDPEFAFDPTIGNGNHWEAGAGLTAHYMLWRAQAEDQYVGLYLDANITHINNGRERRTFDLIGRPNSRYMLAEKMGTPVEFLRAGTTTGSAGNTSVPVSQFKGVFAPVANLTTIDVNVRSSIQADIAAMINYTRNNWGFDLGYDFWIRSCEKISLPDRPTSDCCPNLCTMDSNSWALKGDAQVFGYMADNSGTGDGSLLQGNPIALSATQCGATIHKGTNADADVENCTGIDRLQNCGIDNAQFAYGRGSTSNSTDQFLTHASDTTETSDAIKTSRDPKFINCCDINLQRTRGLSHKIFLNANYTWDKEGWNPYLGVGGSVEFGKNSSSANCQSDCLDCDTACNTSSCQTTASNGCLDCAVSQWSFWVKGGISFE